MPLSRKLGRRSLCVPFWDITGMRTCLWVQTWQSLWTQMLLLICFPFFPWNLDQAVLNGSSYRLTYYAYTNMIAFKQNILYCITLAAYPLYNSIFGLLKIKVLVTMIRLFLLNAFFMPSISSFSFCLDLCSFTVKTPTAPNRAGWRQFEFPVQ